MGSPPLPHSLPAQAIMPPPAFNTIPFILLFCFPVLVVLVLLLLLAAGNFHVPDLNPPCMVKIFSSMMAAIGKQLKQSVKVFHSLMLYLLLHSS